MKGERRTPKGTPSLVANRGEAAISASLADGGFSPSFHVRRGRYAHGRSRIRPDVRSSLRKARRERRATLPGTSVFTIRRSSGSHPQRIAGSSSSAAIRGGAR